MNPANNNKNLDDAIRRALGSSPAPPDFARWCANHPQQVKTITSRAESAPTGSAASRKIDWSSIMHSKITKLTAAAAITIIAVIIGINFIGRSSVSGLALAEVLEYIQAPGYTFDLTVVTGNQTPTSSPITIRAAVLEPGKMRLNASLGVGEISSIVDTNKGESLLLFHRNKAGILMKNPTPNQKTGAGGIFIMCTKSIENLWSLRDGNEKNLGEKEIDGQPAGGFKVSSEDQYFNYDFIIWARAETAEPYLVEITATPMAGSSELLTWTMSNFDLDVELDESLFSTDVPLGYTLAHQNNLEDLEVQTDSSTGAEQIVEMSSLWSEGNKDQALQVLMKIDWDQHFEFAGDVYLFTMTDQQYISLKPQDQKQVTDKTMKMSGNIRQIAKKMVALGQESMKAEKFIEAEQYFATTLQLGKLLSSQTKPTYIVRMVGIAVKKSTLQEMLKLYKTINDQKKQSEVEKQLKATDTEYQEVKRKAMRRQ